MRPLSVFFALAWAGAAHAASLPAVEAPQAMVVSEQHLATEAGLVILRQGGNAVDAAVGVAYALAVTHPCCGNIGGGGFMLIRRKDGSETVIDFRETAPLAASADMYLDPAGNPVKEASTHGWKAVAVPGSVAGLDAAEQLFGRLGRAKVMAPAIRLARDGFLLGRGDTDILDAGRKYFASDPAARKIFLKPDGSAWQPGERLKQTDLARTLSLIADRGADGFYRGPVAEAMVKAGTQGGGLLSEADLAAYRPLLREPLHCAYRGYQVSTVPPVSSGGVGLCQMLQVLEGYDLAAMGFHSAQSVHVMTETMRHVFRDRNHLLGDPAFVDNPLDRLLAPGYAAEIRSRIQPDKASPSQQWAVGGSPREKPETTHFSVVDAEGNAVAVTFTINGLFGAAVMAPGTGFFLNDEMDDFTVKPGIANMFGLQQGETNAIAPGKRPLSSMTPAIVSRNGELFLVLGSPGGARIATIVLQALVNIIDFGMKPQEAIDAPRFHHQFQPDRLFSEARGFSADSARILREMGYDIVEQRNWGAVSLIERASGGSEQKDGPLVSDQALSGGLRPGWLYGASDVRRPVGGAAGF